MSNSDEHSLTPSTNPLDVDVEPTSHSPQAPLAQPARTRSFTSKDRQHHVRHEIRVWTRDLLIAIGLALIIIIFLYQPVKVEGTSMAPLLSDQERIFINKFVYRFEPIHRGDVVVFWYPLDRTKSFIKRVIAPAARPLKTRPSSSARIAGRCRTSVSVPSDFHFSCASAVVESEPKWSTGQYAKTARP